MELSDLCHCVVTGRQTPSCPPKPKVQQASSMKTCGGDKGICGFAILKDPALNSLCVIHTVITLGIRHTKVGKTRQDLVILQPVV